VGVAALVPITCGAGVRSVLNDASTSAAVGPSPCYGMICG
jgi:hypothetical protein